MKELINVITDFILAVVLGFALGVAISVTVVNKRHVEPREAELHRSQRCESIAAPAREWEENNDD